MLTSVRLFLAQTLLILLYVCTHTQAHLIALVIALVKSHDDFFFRMGGEFDVSNKCEEMRLIQAELMSWAQVFCQDCRLEQQARLGRLHHQISRTFETIYKKLCN